MAHFISQTEADIFFSMEKFPEEDISYSFPHSGEKIIIPFLSEDKRESFLFDISRGKIELSKAVFQSRVRKIYVLRRIDLNGPMHRNPEVDKAPLEIFEPYNGREIPTPHMHVYIEGFGERWAVPASIFIDMAGKENFDLLFDFFKYCNVKKFPNINNTLL
ncbi:MAG TPA: hypothetical protein PK447_02735 [Ignavibacteria bacterium]|nr:hypothetical protein [Ignavibacteria bacterium]